jgi:hypothetical protein
VHAGPISDSCQKLDVTLPLMGREGRGGGKPRSSGSCLARYSAKQTEVPACAGMTPWSAECHAELRRPRGHGCRANRGGEVVGSCSAANAHLPESKPLLTAIRSTAHHGFCLWASTPSPPRFTRATPHGAPTSPRHSTRLHPDTTPLPPIPSPSEHLGRYTNKVRNAPKVGVWGALNCHAGRLEVLNHSKLQRSLPRVQEGSRKTL